MFSLLCCGLYWECSSHGSLSSPAADASQQAERGPADITTLKPLRKRSPQDTLCNLAFIHPCITSHHFRTSSSIARHSLMSSSRVCLTNLNWHFQFLKFYIWKRRPDLWCESVSSDANGSTQCACTWMKEMSLLTSTYHVLVFRYMKRDCLTFLSVHVYMYLYTEVKSACVRCSFQMHLAVRTGVSHSFLLWATSASQLLSKGRM